MPSLTYKDLKLSIGIFGGGEVTVQIRTLTTKVTEDQLLALLYPIFDGEEKALEGIKA